MAAADPPPEREPGSPHFAAALARHVAQGASAVQVAEVVTSTLWALLASLSPIIGKAGVIALYRRSLDLTRLTYPWLADIHASRTDLDTSSLSALLALQEPVLAGGAGGALLQQICDLLKNLIGAALTDRLLLPVWDRFSEAQRKQDLSP